MIIDTYKLKDRYVYLKLDDGSEIHVRLDDNAIVVNHVCKLQDPPDVEVKESTRKTYQDMIDGDEDQKEPVKYALFGEHPIYGHRDVYDVDEAKKNEITDNMKISGYGNIKVLTMDEYRKREK